MDATRFDRLVRSLSTAGTRRGVLAFLAALPLLGGVLGVLAPEEVEGKGRRKRRKKRHKHAQNQRNGHRRRNKGTCKPKSRAKACAGTCGVVKAGCKKTVDCGSCACDPPCAVCQSCQGEPGVCVAQAAGTPCGGPGQVCQADGTCACDDTSCPACMSCGVDGTCQGCAGCCNGATCVGSCGDCQVCEEGQCASCGEAGLVCCGGACCASGQCCAGDTCVDDGQPCDECHVCNSGSCQPLTGAACEVSAGGSKTCCNGTCCAGCCDGAGACGFCRVFATSTASDADLGGLEGADQTCRSLAFDAELPGHASYMAWLSIENGPSPATRFRCHEQACSTEGYRLVDGITVIANDWADIFTLKNGVDFLRAKINQNENGEVIPGESFVWTNTSQHNGTDYELDCGDWMSTSGNGYAGSTDRTTLGWTFAGFGDCAFGDRRLFCFQQE